MDFSNADKKLIKVADFLKSSKSGCKIHEGIMAEKRVEVFKGIPMWLIQGTLAVKALTSAAFAKTAIGKALKITTVEEAQRLLKEMIDEGFFLRASRMNNTKYLQPDSSRSWSDDAYYAWVYQGSQLMTILGAVALLVISFCFVMYPLWPSSLRGLAWYFFMAGVGFIGFLMVLAVVRLIVFAITVVTHKPGIWLFPNLFEDVGFFASFVPVWDWHKPAKAE